ncbi:MAG: DNA adenine methylase [Methanoregula sp.]|nr:DNA adenine methylase [Methanoregula sp.]
MTQLKLVPAAHPFMKWAGGKTQLLYEFFKRFPPGLKTGEITRYVEPFIGGGAVFFFINEKFSFESCTICDSNEELVLTYRVIKDSTRELIRKLGALESEYLSKEEKGRELQFYTVRDAFNQNKAGISFDTIQPVWVERAAQVIFLNRTCFNGLFRMNRKGEFNVPFGKYKNPRILNEDNLSDAAAVLKNTRILLGDFSSCRPYIDAQTFVYFDPPYRPLNDTSFFTSYGRKGFSDADQQRLAEVYRKLDKAGVKCMLSNSDPKNENPTDTFFDTMYAGFTIERVPARRIINSKGSGRGEINELVITNY